MAEAEPGHGAEPVEGSRGLPVVRVGVVVTASLQALVTGNLASTAPAFINAPAAGSGGSWETQGHSYSALCCWRPSLCAPNFPNAS